MDGGGRDAVVDSAAPDDSGRSLWTTGPGHPVHGHVGDHILSRQGLEIRHGMETEQQDANGLCIADADACHPILAIDGRDADTDKGPARGWLCVDLSAVIEAAKAHTGHGGRDVQTEPTGSMVLIADLLGDRREEVVTAAAGGRTYAPPPSPPATGSPA